MPKVIWSKRAVDDIERLHSFLKEKSETAAMRAVQVILEVGRQIEQFPEMGKLVPRRSNHRDFIKAFGSGAYVVRYRVVSENYVVVVKVWHGKENREITT
jgi:plasmid stabilization system protein ParE